MLKKILLFYSLMLALLFLTPIQGYAASDFSKAQLPLDSNKGVDYLVTTVNKYTQGDITKDGGTYMSLLSKEKVGTTYVLYFNSEAYSKQSSKVKQNILTIMSDTLDNSTITTPDKNRITNWIDSLDTTNSVVVKTFSGNTKTDLIAASNLWLPFTGPISTFLGLVTLLIAVLLTLSYVWDLAFINIPFIQVALWNNGQQMTHDNKPLFVSQDVVRAFRATGVDDSILSSWFKFRVKTTILLGICLAYLVSNQIWLLLGWIADALSRIITL